MSLRLFVIRHGETDWSRQRRFAGWQDIPLSERGRRQCEAVAAALAGFPLAAIYASPLERTRTAAEEVAKPHRLEVRIEPSFQEMGFGDWEGLTREEAARRYPEDYDVWRRTPDRFWRPGGERVSDVAARVVEGLGRLRQSHEGHLVALVTHAVVTRLIVLDALGLSAERLWTIDASPAGLTEVEYQDDWVTLHRVNTLAHLDESLA